MLKVRSKGVQVMVLMIGLLMALPAIGFGGKDDISQAPNCPICGMDRHKFAHSRMMIHYEDGTSFGSCSLHCTALEIAYHPGKIPAKIQVGDYNTKKLIDADKAVWVMGGSKMGVMTANAKWAFADEKAAGQFISQNGGKIVDFETVLSAAYTDMYKDTKMIREKRKKMKHMKNKGMTKPGNLHMK